MTPVLRRCALGAILISAVGCGPKPKYNVVDSGEPDAGVDAGVPPREKGEDPPLGYSLAVEQSKTAPATDRVGISVAMALDQHDQPMIAYLHEDPNGDGVLQDTRVMFTRWDGVANAWETPRLVAVVGQLDTQHPHRQVAIARDPTSGALGVAYVTSSAQVHLALSDDEGAGWSIEEAHADNPSSHAVSNPALAMAGGEVFIAYHQANRRCTGPVCGGIVYRTRSASGSYADAAPPLVAGAEAHLGMPIALEVDGAGKPGLAFFLHTQASPSVTLAFWRPGAASATAVLDSQDVPNATPSVSLAFHGELPRLAYHLTGTDPQALLRFSAAQDAAGTSWAAPVTMPRNATDQETSWYQGVAVGPAGQVAVVGALERYTTPPQGCGGPKLHRSSNGTDFTVCSPDGANFFARAGLWSSLAFSRSGKLTLVFLYDQRFNPSIAPGVILWRER